MKARSLRKINTIAAFLVSKHTIYSVSHGGYYINEIKMSRKKRYLLEYLPHTSLNFNLINRVFCVTMSSSSCDTVVLHLALLFRIYVPTPQ